MAEAAACFVNFFCADNNLTRLSLTGRTRKSLAARGGIAADHANGVELRHFFSDREKLRHWAKRLAPEIHIEAGNDHPDSAVGELLSDLDDSFIKKLGLIDPNDSGIVLDQAQDVLSLLNRA